MPLFICEECGCVDNTARGFFWARSIVTFADTSKDGKALCTACVPPTYSDGGTTSETPGVWHDVFEKKHWSAYGSREEIIKNHRDFINGEILLTRTEL